MTAGCIQRRDSPSSPSPSPTERSSLGTHASTRARRARANARSYTHDNLPGLPVSPGQSTCVEESEESLGTRARRENGEEADGAIMFRDRSR